MAGIVLVPPRDVVFIGLREGRERMHDKLCQLQAFIRADKAEACGAMGLAVPGQRRPPWQRDPALGVPAPPQGDAAGEERDAPPGVDCDGPEPVGSELALTGKTPHADTK